MTRYFKSLSELELVYKVEMDFPLLPQYKFIVDFQDRKWTYCDCFVTSIGGIYKSMDNDKIYTVIEDSISYEYNTVSESEY